MIYRYFLPFCRLSFHFVDQFFLCWSLGWYSSTCLVHLCFAFIMYRKIFPRTEDKGAYSLCFLWGVSWFQVVNQSILSQVFIFTRCLLCLCVHHSPFLSESLWILAVFLFSWCAQRTPSEFLSEWQTPFCLSVLVFWKEFFPSGSDFTICGYFLSAFWKYETAAFWLHCCSEKPI